MANIYERNIPERIATFIQFAEKNPDFSTTFIVTSPDDEGLTYWIDSYNENGADHHIAKRDLIQFCEADMGGSHFCFWDDGQGKSLDEMPVVVAGNEGDFPIVARNFDELLSLMSLGEELYLHGDEASCCNFDGSTQEPEFFEFLTFLEKTLNITPLKTANEGNAIITQARLAFLDEFNLWVNKALTGVDSENQK
ncbi:hypothetical protein B7R74_20825 [Yersinia pseudotuberculosis]|uniref:SMI1/KNR4 family protein n=1 Tax=Yersinia pseudotuberculosis TaxID=633 RepID=A0A380QBD0_YERPU|nr:hypothetical protein [Yersinia pseudotuberculosis]PSH12010.1 hypothetical protein B7R74_20825 [Yersinia pseudotuberculosis]SUP84600.1 Uncharacterised protein [Yersinia pseudotuberculosis]